MTTKESVEKAIRENSCFVLFDTSTKYYNESYIELLDIGSKLKAGSAEKRDVVNLVGGLLAWNQGAKHAVKLSGAMDQFSADNSSFKMLIKKLKDIERNGVDIENSEKTVEEILTFAQKTLNVDSVVMPSKLIHFISPRFFAMTDTNVAKGAKASTNTVRGYVEYIQKLWELGFHEPSPKEDNLKKYWEKKGIVFPMRAVDCTLYAAGKKI